MYLNIEPVDFQKDVIEASETTPVLVDFWAEWCGPCHMLSPTLEKLAEEAGDKWILTKLNTEIQPDIAMKYNIRSIPNVKMFYKGVVSNEFIGALAESDVVSWLDEHLPE